MNEEGRQGRDGEHDKRGAREGGKEEMPERSLRGHGGEYDGRGEGGVPANSVSSSLSSKVCSACWQSVSLVNSGTLWLGPTTTPYERMVPWSSRG